jgi:hypothetical protein
VELEVEQPAMGTQEDVEPPTEVDGDSNTMIKGDREAGLKMEYRPGGPWAERPQ